MSAGDEAAKDLASRVAEARERYRAACEAPLALDMSRGKPSPEQLDLSEALLELPGAGDHRSAAGLDCRNYGGDLEGLPEARELFAAYLRVAPERLFVQGNSSLRLMHDLLAAAALRGVPGGDGSWSERGVRFLCPVPGYDRHFHLCEHLGIGMVPVPLTEDGPDHDALLRGLRDPSVRGIFCVPRYSNPTGVCYARETVELLATTPTAAPDFRIVWDDAYARHGLQPGETAEIADLLELCAEAGHAERPWVFGSTSKVTFGGAGLSMVAVAGENHDWLRRSLSRQTIGPDKINQLRHVRFFAGRLERIVEHMGRHADLLRPKFETVEGVLRRRLGGLEGATWSRPGGGYFVSVDLPGGTARRTCELALEAGLKLTPAGATFPGGDDPRDSNVRLAPSFPAVDELERAAELFADCALVAAGERESL